MPRRRFRARVNWAIRWGGPLLCAAVAAIYCVTANRALCLWRQTPYRKLGLDLWRGQVRLWHSRDTGPAWDAWYGWSCRLLSRPGQDWSLDWGSSLSFRASSRIAHIIWIPLYAPVPPVLIVSALAWRRHQSARRPHVCPSCHYDLSGLPPGSPCPECAHTQAEGLARK
jgi:hypothetical protein